LGEDGRKETSLKRIILAAFATAFTFSGALADEFGLATFDHNSSHGGLIAAHPILPFGMQARIHTPDNGRSAVAGIIDGGNFAPTRGETADDVEETKDAQAVQAIGPVLVVLGTMIQGASGFFR